jgi:hypothetical protein
MSGLVFCTLVKTCRATGVVGKFSAAHPRYEEEHERVAHLLGVTPDALVERLKETRNPNAPPVATTGFLYRYE